MARTTKLNSRGMAELLKSPGARASLEAPARAVLARMQSTAPRATGELAGSLEIWDDTTDRAVKRIGSRTAAHAIIVEANTGFMARSL
jgi:hypothetical protein